MKEAAHFLSVGAELGEGPAWFDDALWFVDIKGRHIYRHRTASQAPDRWEMPEMVGWVLPSKASHLIVGLESGPHRFDPNDGSVRRIAEVEAELPDNRLNDAAVDHVGRVFFGTMDNAEQSLSGRMYLLDQGIVRATAVPSAIITNGPAIPPVGDRLYHVDTLARTVSMHEVGDDGHVGPGAPFQSFTPDQGHPDGAICDAEGGVWIGFYGGWAARRYSPEGRMTDEVRFPVANVTKIAIGGPDGRTAYATTARQGLDAAALDEQPLAGDIFTFPVAVLGAPTHRANS